MKIQVEHEIKIDGKYCKNTVFHGEAKERLGCPQYGYFGGRSGNRKIGCALYEKELKDAEEIVKPCSECGHKKRGWLKHLRCQECLDAEVKDSKK